MRAAFDTQYAECVQVGSCAEPSYTRSQTRDNYYGNAEFADYPVIYVDWYQAKTYCAWRGARLPTEAEWEKAARGTDGRAYPWGKADANCDLANYKDCKYDRTKPVGSYPAGASPYGAMDMTGNVWEWTADWYGKNYYSSSPDRNPTGPTSGKYRILRSGSFNDDKMYLRSSARFKEQHYTMDSVTGFRCARSAE